MNNTGTYNIDKNLVLEKAYDLLCVFFANKEIARKSDPSDADAPLASLEKLFFTSKASRLLIEIAVSMRVIDDQMYHLPDIDPTKKEYYKLRKQVDGYDFGMFDELNLDLRNTCNKIIHSNVLEPHTSPGIEAHDLDHAYKHGLEDERSIDWTHYSGYVRLAGTEHKKQWYVLLDIEVFISAIYKILK